MKRFLLAPLAASLLAGVARGQGYLLAGFDGAASYDAFGASLAAAGDVDGDGVPDVIVGIPGRDAGGLPDSGEARVYSLATGAVLLVVAGTAAGDELGFAVAGAGDVDGDGTPDLLVGAPQSVSAGPGYARLCSGAGGAVLQTFAGTAAGDRFGWSVAGAGLVDADTVGDSIVGAPRTGSGAGPGYAKVFSGAAGILLLNLNGTSVGDLFGEAVCGPGDLDGDGHADLFVGAPGDPTNGVSSGSARVFSGLTGLVIGGFYSFNTYTWQGCSVASAGLVNAGDVPDLIVGALGGFGGNGMARVHSGQGGATLVTTVGDGPGELFGASVAGAGGDVDGDGFADVLAGAPGSPIYATAGYVRLVSGATETTALTIPGASAGDAFGWAMASVGDVNADGVPDLAVGAPGADPGGLSGAGRASVLSLVGVPPGSTAYGSGCPGPGGLTPVLSTSGGFPTSVGGNPRFGVLLSNATPGKTVVLMLASSATSWLGTPLPIGLAPFGMPACSLLVAPLVNAVGSTVGSGPGGGKERFPFPIPPNPALSGFELFLQGYVVDPGPALLPGAMTGGLHLVLL